MKAQRRKTPGVPFFHPDWLEVRTIVRSTRDALQRYGAGELLDVGCGEKPFAVFGEHLSTWTGVDLPSNPAADVHGTADALPFGDAAFDTVLCTQVLEHVPDPVKAVAEVFRVLRPGGHSIFTVPQYWALHEEPYDFYRYTPYGLRHLLGGAGFEVVALDPGGSGFELVGQAFNLNVVAAVSRLPFGKTFPVRAAFAPLYTVANATAWLLARLLPNPKDLLNLCIIGRKPSA